MAWVSKSRQGNCTSKVLRISIPVPSSDDIPPGVVRARERVGWNETPVELKPLCLSPQVVLGRENVNAVAVKSETTPRNPVLEPLFLRTEAGEVLKRQRVNGPWFPLQTNSGQFRGSARLALDIASSSERTDLAVNQFEMLIYNSSTVASKESYFNLWTSICHALKLPPLPVTKDSLIQVAAIRRAAGYRAAMTYVYEARSRHIRAGFAWPFSLDSVVADCRRASKRALGPASRAEEIRLVWWRELQRKVGHDVRMRPQKKALQVASKCGFGSVHIFFAQRGGSFSSYFRCSLCQAGCCIFRCRRMIRLPSVHGDRCHVLVRGREMSFALFMWARAW